ncbi:MAG: hypothetical protein N3D15_04860 [Syntrophorhabdaceae bacterium]|nr:hypothetical protein [Syntrophorhabdaceae bacterium]
MKKLLWVFILFTAVSFISPFNSFGCSCLWEGPFLVVAKHAFLIIRGRVIHHNLGRPPTMVVLLLETLKGGVFDSGLVIQMGDGMHCRPTLEGFPLGSEWILAINGRGSKPGMGLALSHCGEYWLRVENNEVTGSIYGGQLQKERMPLDELKHRLKYTRFKEFFKGRVSTGTRYNRPFGPCFMFILEPITDGWEIVIKEQGREENFARLTPPLHSVPNPRFIEGWHLSDNPSKCATREYLSDNTPGNPRRFIFSPEVGKGIDGQGAVSSVTPREIERIEGFGRGLMTIEGFRLEPGINNCPKIEWLEFSVLLEGGY